MAAFGTQVRSIAVKETINIGHDSLVRQTLHRRVGDSRWHTSFREAVQPARFTEDCQPGLRACHSHLASSLDNQAQDWWMSQMDHLVMMVLLHMALAHRV